MARRDQTSTAPPPPPPAKKSAKQRSKGKKSLPTSEEDNDHVMTCVKNILSGLDSEPSGDENDLLDEGFLGGAGRDSTRIDCSLERACDTRLMSTSGYSVSLSGGDCCMLDGDDDTWGQRVWRLLGSVLSDKDGRELIQILSDQMAAQRLQAIEEASINGLTNHRALMDFKHKDQHRHIAAKYNATSTKLSALLSFDLECSNSDLLEELSISLVGDCADPAVLCGDFIKGRVSIDARHLERIVMLAQANMCTIGELRTSIEIGTHKDGGWDCVQALMDNTHKLTAKFSNKAEILDRMREGKKRARLMALTKKPTPTPQRKTAPRKHAASKSREPSRRHTPLLLKSRGPWGSAGLVAPLVTRPTLVQSREIFLLPNRGSPARSYLFIHSLFILCEYFS